MREHLRTDLREGHRTVGRTVPQNMVSAELQVMVSGIPTTRASTRTRQVALNQRRTEQSCSKTSRANSSATNDGRRFMNADS